MGREGTAMSFPTLALGPDNKLRPILVDAEGRLVVDTSPKPAETFPVTEVSPRVDADGKLETT